MKTVAVEDRGEKKFRFGGGEVLTAMGKVTFPAQLAGNRVRISTYVVASPIPLLWSRPSMVRAGVVLNLLEHKAKILGNWTDLNITSAGHHSLEIRLQKEEMEHSLVSLPEDEKERKETLLKIHRHMGHPRRKTMMKLLENINQDNPMTEMILKKIEEKCQTCKVFKTTPPRLVVSLPPACDFNEVLSTSRTPRYTTTNSYST